MSDTYAYGYNISLAGFKYKRIIFKGKAAHAGVLPHLGVNALNEFTLFNSALGMLGLEPRNPEGADLQSAAVAAVPYPRMPFSSTLEAIVYAVYLAV